MTKPVKGRTTIRVDDSQGATRFRAQRKDVLLADVAAVAAELLEPWELQRADIKAARSLRIA